MKLTLGLLLPLVWLAACTPAYIADQADLYSRKLGVIDSFDVQRWHNRALSQGSHLVVAAAADEPATSLDIANALSRAFTVYFASVSILPGSSSQAVALEQAKVMGGDFLLHTRVVESSPPQGKEWWGWTQRYRGIQLLIVIVDINSGDVVDKVRLYSHKSKVPFVTDRLPALLQKPLLVVAEDLVGA